LLWYNLRFVWTIVKTIAYWIIQIWEGNGWKVTLGWWRPRRYRDEMETRIRLLTTFCEIFYSNVYREQLLYHDKSFICRFNIWKILIYIQNCMVFKWKCDISFLQRDNAFLLGLLPTGLLEVLCYGYIQNTGLNTGTNMENFRPFRI